jgi:hypothetical protein
MTKISNKPAPSIPLDKLRASARARRAAELVIGRSLVAKVAKKTSK